MDRFKYITGSLDFVTEKIEILKKEGYVFIEAERERSWKTFFKWVYTVKMEKVNNVSYPNYEPVIHAFFTGFYNAFISVPLEQQLQEAIDREDYETAAILRDQIKKKKHEPTNPT